MHTLFMIGDSLIEYGSWESLLPGYKIINRGISGETTEGCAARIFQEITAHGEDPTHIFIMTGTNNLILGNNHFTEILKSMIPQLESLFPKTKITLNSIFPLQLSWIHPDSIVEINEELLDITKETGANFLDITKSFHPKNNSNNSQWFSADNVHLSQEGYVLWAEEIQNHLATINPDVSDG